MKRPPWRIHHPRPWELSLQKEIHTLGPRCNTRRAVLLGEDAEGLAAVTVVESEHDASSAVIECVAVALRRRRPGGSGCADEAMEQSIEWALGTADDAGLDQVLLTAKTHPQNAYGRKLAERHGFGLFARTEEFDEWQVKVNL